MFTVIQNSTIMIYNYYVSICKFVSASYTPLITDRNLQKIIIQVATEVL